MWSLCCNEQNEKSVHSILAPQTHHCLSQTYWIAIFLRLNQREKEEYNHHPTICSETDIV